MNTAELKKIIREALREELSEREQMLKEAASTKVKKFKAPYPELFLDYRIDGDMYDPEDYDPDDYGYDSVSTYYLEKDLPREDLMLTYLFVSEDELKDAGGDVDNVENFGFQLANGDYLYHRVNHDIDATYVKCRDYNSMINYVKNGYLPDQLDAPDLIER